MVLEVLEVAGSPQSGVRRQYGLTSRREEVKDEIEEGDGADMVKVGQRERSGARGERTEPRSSSERRAGKEMRADHGVLQRSEGKLGAEKQEEHYIAVGSSWVTDPHPRTDRVSALTPEGRCAAPKSGACLWMGRGIR